jgi:hypothetical protein
MKIILPYQAYKNIFFDEVTEACNRGCRLTEQAEYVEQEIDTFKYIDITKLANIYSNGGSVQGYEIFCKMTNTKYNGNCPFTDTITVYDENGENPVEQEYTYTWQEYLTSQGYEKDGYRYVLLSHAGELLTYDLVSELGTGYTLIDKDEYIVESEESEE